MEHAFFKVIAKHVELQSCADSHGNLGIAWSLICGLVFLRYMNVVCSQALAALFLFLLCFSKGVLNTKTSHLLASPFNTCFFADRNTNVGSERPFNPMLCCLSRIINSFRMSVCDKRGDIISRQLFLETMQFDVDFLLSVIAFLSSSMCFSLKVKWAKFGLIHDFYVGKSLHIVPINTLSV